MPDSLNINNKAAKDNYLRSYCYRQRYKQWLCSKRIMRKRVEDISIGKRKK
jgi:hypothetical protein